MFDLISGLQIVKLNQIKIFKLIILSLFVASITPQINFKTKSDVETIIETVMSHYLSIMAKHNDWLRRILGVVKLEMTYRQRKLNCTTDSCLYSIQLNQPMRYRRLAKKRNRFLKYEKKPFSKEESMENMTEEKHDPVEGEMSGSVSLLPPLKSNAKHMNECTGKYVHFCKNKAKCVYVDLLQEAVCLCRTGFTGNRCVDFSLSDAVQSLRNFEMKTVQLSALSKKDQDSILSVMDATARFTYKSNLLQPSEVKSILGT